MDSSNMFTFLLLPNSGHVMIFYLFTRFTNNNIIIIIVLTCFYILEYNQ